MSAATTPPTTAERRYALRKPWCDSPKVKYRWPTYIPALETRYASADAARYHAAQSEEDAEGGDVEAETGGSDRDEPRRLPEPRAHVA